MHLPQERLLQNSKKVSIRGSGVISINIRCKSKLLTHAQREKQPPTVRTTNEQSLLEERLGHEDSEFLSAWVISHNHLLLSIPFALPSSSLWQPEMETTGQKSSVFCEGAAVVLLSLQGNKTFLDSGGKLSNGHCFLSEMKSLVDCYCHITPFGATTTLLLRGGCLVYLMSRMSYLMGLTITETDQSHCYDVISLHLMLFLEHRFNLTKKVQVFNEAFVAELVQNRTLN